MGLGTVANFSQSQGSGRGALNYAHAHRQLPAEKAKDNQEFHSASLQVDEKPVNRNSLHNGLSDLGWVNQRPRGRALINF